MTLWFPHWSGPVGWIEDFLIGHWPEGDEDAMRRLSKNWSDMSKALTELKDPADKAMSNALTAIDGKTHDAMSTYWQDIVGGDGSDLNSVIAMCDSFAKQLEQGATDIEHTKIVIYISVATMIAMAFVPGIGEAFDAAASALVKATIRKFGQELIDKLAMKGASALAERTGLKIAEKVAAKVAVKEAKDLGEGAAAKFAVSTMAQSVTAGALGGATDLAANVVQAAEGEDVDFNSSWKAAGAGAIAGTVGGVVSHPSNAGMAKVAKNVDLGTNSAKAVIARGVAAVPGNVLGNAVSTVATGGKLDQGVLDGAGGGLGRVKPGEGSAATTPHVTETSHTTPQVESHDSATTPSAAHSDSATQTTTASDSSASNADTSSKPASVAAQDNGSVAPSSGAENASSTPVAQDSVGANSTQDSRPTAAPEAQSASNNVGAAASDRASTQNPAAQGTTTPNTDRAATPAAAGTQVPTTPSNRDVVLPTDRSAPADTSRPAADTPQRPDSTQRPDAVQRPESTQRPETPAPQNVRSTTANSSATETPRAPERSDTTDRDPASSSSRDSSDNTPRNSEPTDRTTTSARDAQVREPRPVTEDSGRRASDTSDPHPGPSREAPGPDKPTGPTADRKGPPESLRQQRDSTQQSDRPPTSGNSRTPTRDRDSTPRSSEAADRSQRDQRSESTPDRNKSDRTERTEESSHSDPKDSSGSPTDRSPRQDEPEVPRSAADQHVDVDENRSETDDSVAADESLPTDTLGSSEDSADDVPPVTEFDNYLENGEGVVYRADRTSIGDDPRTHRVRENTLNEGEHDVIVHGSPEGAPIPSLGPEVHPEQIVDAILGNPNYEPGTPVRLLSCFSGNEMGWAQHVADRLGVPVRAPSDAVGTARKPNSPAAVRGDGEFRTFHPNSEAHPGRENPLDPAGQLPDKQPHASDNRRSAYDEPPGWDFMGGGEDSGTRESSLNGLPDQPDRPEAGTHANGLRGLDLPGFEPRETRTGGGVSERSEAVEPQHEPTTDRSHGDTGSLGNFHGDGRPAHQPDLTRAEVIRAINENSPLVMPEDVRWFPKDQSALMGYPGLEPVDVHFDVRPIDSGAVAEFHVREDGKTYDVHISPRARDEDIVRALAHEVAEIKLLQDPKVSAEPSLDHAEGLTPRLGGQLAEVKVVTAHIERAELDPQRAHELPGLRRDLADLLDGLGMRDPGNSQARWRLLNETDARMAPRLERQLDRIPPSRDLAAEHHGEPGTRSAPDEHAGRSEEAARHSLAPDETARRFESGQDGVQYGERVLGEVRDSLPPDQMEAVQRYVRAQWINDVLRSPDPGGMLDRLVDDHQGFEAIRNHIGTGVEPTHEMIENLAKRPDLHPDARAAVDSVLGHSKPQIRIQEMSNNWNDCRTMRTHLGDIDPTIDVIGDYIRHLDPAVSHPIPEPIVLVRGLHRVEHLVIDDHGTVLGDDKDIWKLKNQVQSEPGVMSTSLSDRSLEGFGRYQLELEAPAGTKGLWIGNRREFGGENEFLGERGLKYVITDVVEAPSADGQHGAGYILKGKIVPSDFVLEPEGGRAGVSPEYDGTADGGSDENVPTESSSVPEVPPTSVESGSEHGSLALPDPVHASSAQPGPDVDELAHSSVKPEDSAETVQAASPPHTSESEPVSAENQAIPAHGDTEDAGEPHAGAPTDSTRTPDSKPDESSVQRPHESSPIDPQRVSKPPTRESLAPDLRNPDHQDTPHHVDVRQPSDHGASALPDHQVPRTSEIPGKPLQDNGTRYSQQSEQSPVSAPQRERPQDRPRAAESSRPQEGGHSPTRDHPGPEHAGPAERQSADRSAGDSGAEPNRQGSQHDPSSMRRDEVPSRGPSEDDVRRAQHARRWRDWLRPLRPDANRVMPVTTKLGPNAKPAFDIRRYSNTEGGPVAVARIKVHVTADPNIHPQWLSHLWENAQKATDFGFNREQRLLSGDRIFVDLVHTSDPAEANLHIDVGERPGQWRPDMPVDAITRQLRDHLGLLPPDPNHPGLNPHEIRQLSNDVAYANTPRRFDNPSDSRSYGEHRLGAVERPEHQAAVEDALRDGNRFLVCADPRTNRYGELINDGGIEVPGRRNNCADCALSALSAFYGHPQVSAPGWLDKLPGGGIDIHGGERGGPERAAEWLGDGLHQFGGGASVPAQFGHLHDLVDRMGPGSSALVVNEWQARDPETGEPLYNSDGTPRRGALHATVIVYPRDASGPVWWDPQAGTMSDHPPRNMVYGSTDLSFTPISAHPGGTHGGIPHEGAGRGVPGSDIQPRQAVSAVPVRGDRLAGPGGTESAGGRERAGAGRDESGDRRGNRSGDRVPELEHHDDRG
ncbi:toxin glutamine deamidase domain-containing protein [Nocardia vaccinii]|uniref:toxin glutamine deamidase domain-containing protein n=1 Tax=Nocardia vaccinii TaxID=1822 RepID=UPI000A000C8B|nr:toxin glutamine deamidase domain-containing protein [Nocardia vaccinii]